MTVERAPKAGKHELMVENLRWRGAPKVRMHMALCYSCTLAVAVTAYKIGGLELANRMAASIC